MKKQKTFVYYGIATEWLDNLAKCFEIMNATISKHQIKEYGRMKPRWTVEVDFE